MLSKINVSGNLYKYIDTKLNNRSISDNIRLFIFLKRSMEYTIKKHPHKFPTLIQIQTINQCNASCIMCPNSYIKNEKIELMSDSLFKKIIMEIGDQNEFSFVHLYLQNEPLMDAKIFEKIKFIKKISNGTIATGIVTNGSLFTDEKIKQLIESGNDIIVFSIDAFKRVTFEKIRKGLNFDKIINSIEKILSSKYSNRVFVKYVIQKDNIAEVNDFENFWKKKGVEVLFSDLLNRTGDLENFDDYSTTIEKKYKLEGEKIFSGLVKNCTDLLYKFNILVNGDVILCCNDYNKKMILGNVNEKSISEIWNSETFQKIRKTVHEGNYKKIPVCKDCNKMC